ncbi:TraM recognition domain-containing protein [Saccharopolyspora sp. K220]|nr:TraM recognition domain-containing protein [Saccharopolyspora soli]
MAAAVMLALTAVAGVGMLGAAATTALDGGPWQIPPPDVWVEGVLGALSHPDRPGVTLGPPWEAALAAHPGWYWTITVVLLVAVATAVGALAVPGWRRFGPTPLGHATRTDLRRELSARAARRTAEWTRPSLTPEQRKRAPLTDLATPLHRGPTGQLWSPLHDPTGVLAPTQSGKSRMDLVHKVIAAPGALLCSSTKPDLLEFAALARTRRPKAGPVLVLDATGEVRWPAQIRPSPIRGCTSTTVARRRAETLVDAASVGLERIGGNDKVFRERAKTVVQAYLLAAALDGRTVEALVRWSITKPPDHEPVTLLRSHGYPELADNLRAEIGMVAETSDAVWLSVRRVIEPWMDPRIRDLCTPEPGQEFDARAFVRSRGSLFVVAGEHQAAQVRPVLTALVEDLLTTEQDMALSQPSRRLDPPASNVLDELYDATPIPRLPEILADSAGRGVLIHWAAQSMAHLDELYEETGRRQLLDNTTTLTIWSGIKDSKTLEWISTIADHHDKLRHQIHSDGLFGVGRTAVGTESVPTYRPGAVRTLRRGRVLLVHRNLKPILARVLDVRKRPDWSELAADQEAVRAGTAAVDDRGYALPPTGAPR